MAILDLHRSMEYTYSFAPPSVGRPVRDWEGIVTPESFAAAERLADLQVYEGLWWRHTTGTAGFLALVNTTGQTVSAELALSGTTRPASRTLTLHQDRLNGSVFTTSLPASKQE
jgi:hypothetical protein